MLVALLAAASGYLFLPEQAATLVVLALLGILSTVGVVALLAGAAGMLAWKSAAELRPSRRRPAQAFLENMAEGVLMTARRRHAALGERRLPEADRRGDDRDLHSIERLFSDNPDAAEAVYRLAVAADRGRRATEEIRMPGGIGGRASGARWYRVRVNPVGGADAQSAGSSPTSRASASTRRTFFRSCRTPSTISTTRRPASSRSSPTGASAT